MERTYLTDLVNHIGERVKIAGWVNVRRDHGKLVFFDIRDRTGCIQVVCSQKARAAYRTAEKVRSEWVLAVEGEVKKRPESMVNPEQELGGIELEAHTIEVLSAAYELPFDRDGALNLDTLLDYRPLTLRRSREQAIFQVQHHLIKAYRDALTAKGFYEFEAPKIVGGDAEGGAAAFPVEYLYGQKAFLATSPQLYKQIMVGVLEQVFAVGNVFRGEKHSTSRHLSEYTSLDAEMGFISDHSDIMRTLTDVLHFIFNEISEHCAKNVAILESVIPQVPKSIPHLKLREAQVLITKETGVDCTTEKDLAPEHERWLCEYAHRTFESDFIFITHFPVEKTAFYAYEDPEDPGYTRYFDLLFRGVEIASGGQRVHDYETLKKRIAGKGLDPKKFSFYLQAFKYGMPPHGGWGLGLERLTQKLLGLENVKEATLFPRDINRIDLLLSEPPHENPL